MEKPHRYIPANVPMTEIGSAIAGITVARTLRRNRKMTITTRAIVSINVNCTSCTDLRIDSERSTSTSSDTDGGNCARKSGSSAFTASVTATVLASGCRCTARTIDLRPLNQLATLSFSTESSTTAISASRTGAPFRQATISGLYRSARASGPEASRTNVCSGPSSVPSGLFELAAASAARTSSTAMPFVASASGSKRTRTAYFCAP